MTLSRAAAAEAIGTALLLAIVVGSGIMGERLAQGNGAIALLANSLATGAGLYTLIIILGPVSGAHFNPIVSGVSVWNGHLSRRNGVVYVLAQIGGAFVGVAAAHAMFGLPHRTDLSACPTEYWGKVSAKSSRHSVLSW